MRRLLSHAPILGLALVSAILGTLLANGVFNRGDAAPDYEQVLVYEQSRPLPQFALLDQRGEPAGRDALEGQWQLLFFGFTSCPDICPNTLIALSRARAQLSADGQTVPNVVFVSVDPDRDDPATVANYLRYFDENFLGLTAPNREVILDFTRQIGVAVDIGEPDETGYYDVGHTSSIFVVNPQGEMVGRFPFANPFVAYNEVDVLVRDLRRILEAR